ncbi:MAG TPA: hypothetical protein VHB48_05325 [Chitinophagaceae bacterium]|nr:hypothetical protein [Chitinophagaceae bacterium]
MAEMQINKQAGIVVLNFGSDNAPIIRERTGRDWIEFGDKNDYSDFLISLYNKSPKHGAIINGKAKYIFGGGLAKDGFAEQALCDQVNDAGEKIKAQPVNNMGETLNEVLYKSILDTRIHGGFRWVIVWNKMGGFEILHAEFQKLRRGKNNNFYWKKNWRDSREQPIEYPEFNISNRQGAQVFAYDEYRPGTEDYPLPEYINCIDYIQADAEVAAHTYGNAQGGFTASKMISFFNGDIDEEGKRVIEKKLTEKFTGRRGQKFMLTFNTDSSKKPVIDDLGASDMTKEDFTAIDKNIEQNIFTGHEITSPALFGVKTEGQLGNNQELQTAYTIFNNTYARPKQQDLERIVNYFAGLMGMGDDYRLQTLNPIGLQLDIKDVINVLPKSFVFEYFNIPKDKWNEQTIAETGK